MCVCMCACVCMTSPSFLFFIDRASIKNALNSKLCGKVKEQLESPQGTWKSKYVGLMAASNAFVTLKFCRDPKIPEQLLE